jgi:hypothetical protein
VTSPHSPNPPRLKPSETAARRTPPSAAAAGVQMARIEAGDSHCGAQDVESQVLAQLEHQVDMAPSSGTTGGAWGCRRRRRRLLSAHRCRRCGKLGYMSVHDYFVMLEAAAVEAAHTPVSRGYGSPWQLGKTFSLKFLQNFRYIVFIAGSDIFFYRNFV